MKLKPTVTALLAGSLAIAGVTGLVWSDYSAPNHISSDRHAASYSDEQILNGVVLGQGDVARDHPELRMNESGFRPADQRSVAAFDDRILAAVPDFHNTVAVPLRSGDPYVVSAALTRLNSGVKTALRNVDYQAALRSRDDGPQMDTLYTKNNVAAVTNVAAVWQVAAAHTVAGAAEAVALVVIVPAAATYQFNADSADQILKSKWVAKITEALSNRTTA